MVGFLGTRAHHGFPVFLSHLEALLSLFISLEKKPRVEGCEAKISHSHSPSRITRIIRIYQCIKKWPFSVRAL